MTTAVAEQLAFDLEALGLRLEPTIAMRAGKQEVYQHSYCGTVVVKSSLGARDRLGLCPACDPEHAGDEWWYQRISETGLAGLYLVPAVVSSLGGTA